MTPIQQFLLKIQQSGAFEELRFIEENQKWREYLPEEKVLFARLLFLKGKKQLQEDDPDGLNSFARAREVDAQSPDILFEQAVIFFKERKRANFLDYALDCISLCVEKRPRHFESLHLQSQVLVEKGMKEQDPSFFYKAHTVFESLLQLEETALHPEHLVTIYWGWGFCLASIGGFSGEPQDFQFALQKYQIALEKGCQDPHFFHQYGHTLADFASLVGNNEYLKQALYFFELAIKMKPSESIFWHHQACCLQALSIQNGDLDILEKAVLSFSKASEIQPNFSFNLFKWAQCETTISKVEKDLERLQKGIALLQEVIQIEGVSPYLLTTWADAELFLGSHLEDYELMAAAQKKIQKSLEMDPQLLESHYIYGCSYLELGRYFSDSSFYRLAIEQFETGLKLHENTPSFFYGLALAHYALGENQSDLSELNKSLQYFEKVNAIDPSAFSQFFNDWGMALLKMGETTEETETIALAIEKFSFLLEEEEKNKNSILSIDLLYNYGYALDLLGDLTEQPHYIEKSIEVLSQVVINDPDFYQGRFSLAIALWHYSEETFDIQSFYKAIEQFEILIKMDREDGMIRVDFGTALISLGLLIHDPHHKQRSQELFQRAEYELMQAASLGNTEAYYQLVGLYSINENYPFALHFLEKARFFNVLPSIEDLLNDYWLDGLRKTPEFRFFITSLSDYKKNNTNKDETSL